MQIGLTFVGPLGPQSATSVSCAGILKRRTLQAATSSGACRPGQFPPLLQCLGSDCAARAARAACAALQSRFRHVQTPSLGKSAEVRLAGDNLFERFARVAKANVNKAPFQISCDIACVIGCHRFVVALVVARQQPEIKLLAAKAALNPVVSPWPWSISWATPCWRKTLRSPRQRHLAHVCDEPYLHECSIQRLMIEWDEGLEGRQGYRTALQLKSPSV